MGIVATAAARYADGGHFTIFDGIISPRSYFEPVRDALRAAGHPVAYAVLRARLEDCVSRAQSRSANRLADRAVIEQLWHDFAELGSLERHAIDSHGANAEDIAQQMARRLQAGSLDL